MMNLRTVRKTFFAVVNPIERSNTSNRWGIYLVWALVVFTIAYRILVSSNPSFSNTSPTMALCFGGGLLLGRKFWWAPAVLIVLSDFLIGVFKGHGSGIGNYTILTASLFCLSAWMGSLSTKWNGKTWPTLWCGVLLSSILFYVITNTFCWAVYPGYAKTLTGWWQSQSSGMPGVSPPAWFFLRNALIADSIWCAIAGLLFFFRFSPGRAQVAEANA